MKLYTVVVSYIGSIDVEVEASNEDEARTKAEDKVNLMDVEVFHDRLNPQHNGTDVIGFKEI